MIEQENVNKIFLLCPLFDNRGVEGICKCGVGGKCCEHVKAWLDGINCVNVGWNSDREKNCVNVGWNSGREKNLQQ